MIFNSIRWRLQAWLAFLLVCILSAFCIAVYQLQRLNQFQQIDETLARRVAALDSAVRGGPPPGMRPGPGPFPMNAAPPGFHDESRPPPPPLDRPEPRAFRLPPEDRGLFGGNRPGGFYFAVWFRNGEMAAASTNAPGEIPPPDAADAGTLPHIRMRGTLREAYHFTELGDCVLAGRSVATDLEGMRRFGWWLFSSGGVVLALGLGGGWWFTTRAIRPVEEISAAAGRISAGNLSERISVAEPENELGRLAGVLNSTFARLEAAFAQQTQFTADASHELRTPLAVIISEAQTTLARDRSPAEYRETVQTCLDTAQQMRRLTDSLLQLARFDAGQEDTPRAPLDLAEVARNCVEQILPLARQRGLNVQSDLAPAIVLSNAERLGQVVTNLLTNAIQYNKPDGSIQVATRTENGMILLTVSDTGLGIAPEDLPHVFERFYRADKSRSRAEGRNGLGLSICKAIVDTEGGRIEVSSQPGVGTTFTVRLPVSAAAVA